MGDEVSLGEEFLHGPAVFCDLIKRTSIPILGLILHYFTANIFQLIAQVVPSVSSAIDMCVTPRAVCDQCNVGLHLGGDGGQRGSRGVS